MQATRSHDHNRALQTRTKLVCLPIEHSPRFGMSEGKSCAGFHSTATISIATQQPPGMSFDSVCPVQACSTPFEPCSDVHHPCRSSTHADSVSPVLHTLENSDNPNILSIISMPEQQTTLNVLTPPSALRTESRPRSPIRLMCVVHVGRSCL